MLAWWGSQFSREVKDSFSEEVTLHQRPERREAIRQAAPGAGAEALWPTACPSQRGTAWAEGAQPALTRRLRPTRGALPPAAGVWASAGEDGAPAEVWPRSVPGLLHILAETLRKQRATQEARTGLTFLDPESLQTVTSAVKLKELTPWKESYDKPR